MRQEDELDFDRRREKQRRHEKKDLRSLIPIAAVALLLLIIITVLIAMRIVSRQDKASSTDGASGGSPPSGLEETADSPGKDADPPDSMADGFAGTDPSDPQDALSGSMSAQTGEPADVTELLSADGPAEIEGQTVGIDVSKYQGTIDWQQAAASGIDFAMVRIGYRTKQTGEILADSNARYNLQEAQANGIKTGAYFFSTAVSEEEAVQEADWVADSISQYAVTWPVAYNCEGFDDPESRQNGLTSAQRTDIAIAFLNRIYERGYTPMFYAARTELDGDACWDTSRLQQQFRLWIAWYPDSLSPAEGSTDAALTDTGIRDAGGAMWQYTSRGTVPGVPEQVDLNIAYFDYEGTADAKSDTTPEQASADAEALMRFSEVNETVTAKEKVNLRDIPAQGDDSTVLATLSNGDTMTRTGVSDSGWSRLESDGQIYYAVSSYLTADLSYQPAESDGAGSGDGLKTKFTATGDTVTAKIEVNLRALPSVTNPDAVIVAVLHNGETVTRTGINNEYGWSRVDYNGQTLYCISSYLTVVE